MSSDPPCKDIFNFKNWFFSLWLIFTSDFISSAWKHTEIIRIRHKPRKTTISCTLLIRVRLQGHGCGIWRILINFQCSGFLKKKPGESLWWMRRSWSGESWNWNYTWKFELSPTFLKLLIIYPYTKESMFWII